LTTKLRAENSAFFGPFVNILLPFYS